MLPRLQRRSEEHTSELQSHGLISYAVFCLKKKKKKKTIINFNIIIIQIKKSIVIVIIMIDLDLSYHFKQTNESNKLFFFFFNDTTNTEIYTRPYTLSLHDAIPIYPYVPVRPAAVPRGARTARRV